MGHPLLMPTCSAIGMKLLDSLKFFMHPLNGCMVMLSLRGGTETQVILHEVEKLDHLIQSTLIRKT